MPEPHRVEASEARRLLAPNDPHLGFDRFEATDEPESPQRMHEVEVDLVQGHARERLQQDRHVEARAVEGDEEFRALHGRGKILEVGTLDERSSSGTVVHADNGHGTRPSDKPVVSMSRYAIAFENSGQARQWSRAGRFRAKYRCRPRRNASSDRTISSAMRFATRVGTRRGLDASEKSSHVRIPRRQSRSSVR